MHHDAVGQLQHLVQVLADQQHRRRRRCARRAAGAWISATAAKSSPKQGLATISSAASPSVRAPAPRAARCRPTGSAIGASGPGVLTLKAAILASACARIALRDSQQRRAPAARGRSRAAPCCRPRSARRRRRCAAAPRAGCARFSVAHLRARRPVGLAVDPDLPAGDRRAGRSAPPPARAGRCRRRRRRRRSRRASRSAQAVDRQRPSTPATCSWPIDSAACRAAPPAALRRLAQRSARAAACPAAAPTACAVAAALVAETSRC